jgi:hypothetical protein
MTPDKERGWELVPNWVREAYAFYPDGRPLGMVASGGSPRGDVEPLSPTIIALQSMIQDRLGERGRPVSSVYGEHILALVPGRRVHVGALVRGRPDPELRSSMEAVVQDLEGRFGTQLGTWSGAMDELDGLPDALRPVVDRTADRGPGEVEDPMRTRGVFPVTAFDFEGGRGRLKVAVFSAGLAALQGTHVEITYGRDVLRLEGSQPENALDEDGRLSLGTIVPGEAAAAAYLFEPLGPGSSLIEGTLTFFDVGNNPRHFDLPKRFISLELPGVSSAAEGPGQARQLPPDGRSGDVDVAERSWRYPASLGGVDVLRLVRTVLGTQGLMIGPGSEVEAPSPSWAVEGLGAVGPAPVAILLKVEGGDARRLSMRAASTDPVVVAGMVAELRTRLSDAFFRRWRGQASLEEERVWTRSVPPIEETDIDIYHPRG